MDERRSRFGLRREAAGEVGDDEGVEAVRHAGERQRLPFAEEIDGGSGAAFMVAMGELWCSGREPRPGPAHGPGAAGQSEPGTGAWKLLRRRNSGVSYVDGVSCSPVIQR